MIARGYEIHYKQTDEEKKLKAALRDTLDYLGPEMYRKVARCASAVPSFEGFSIGCSFMGIEGYPVAAIWRRYHVQEWFTRPERDWDADRAAVMEEWYIR